MLWSEYWCNKFTSTIRLSKFFTLEYSFKSFPTWALQAHPDVIKRHKRNEIWHNSLLFFSWNTHLRIGKGLGSGHYCFVKSPQRCECSCGVWRWVDSSFSLDAPAVASLNPFQCSSGLHRTVACCLRHTEHNIGEKVQMWWTQFHQKHI